MASTIIDIRREETLEAWKAKKFVVQDPGEDCESNKMMDKDLYRFAQEDNFNDLFSELQRAPSDKQFSVIYKEVGPSGNSLLHVAASNGCRGVTVLLALHFPLLITRQNFQADTAAHLAARAGKFDIIEILVKHTRYEAGTSDHQLLKMKNERENTPLHDAVIYGHADVARYLVSESPEVSHYENKEQKSPLYLAVEASSTDEKKDDILEILLEATETSDGNLSATLKGKSPAHAAIEQKKLAALEKIANKRPDLIHVKDREGGNPLHFASSSNYLEGVKFLLEKFSDCAIEKNHEGHCPIHVACKNGYVQVVEEMVKQWPNPTDFLNAEGQNILHVAAKSGKDAVVKYILRNPKLEALINEKDLDGNTPTHLAAMHGHPKAVFTLVRDPHVDCNTANSKNLTAFFAALNLYERKEEDSEHTNSNAEDTEIHSEQDSTTDFHGTVCHDGLIRNYSGRVNGGKQRPPTVTNSNIPWFGIGLATLILLFFTDVKEGELVDKMKKERGRRKSLKSEDLKSKIEALLVVAVLVAGATYAGAIQMPEGGSSKSHVDNINSNSTPSATPNDNIKSTQHSQNYVICGAVAFHTSILSAIVLCWALFCGVRTGSFAVTLASAFISYSIFFMGCAFTFAVGIAAIKYPSTSWFYTLSYDVFLPLQVLLIIPLFFLSALQVVYPVFFIFLLLLWLLSWKKLFKLLCCKKKK